MQWIATCPHETLQTLSSELEKLGITQNNQQKLRRGIRFEADLQLAYKAHLSLHTASRIQRVIHDFSCNHFQEFQKEIQSITWPEYLRSHKPFKIELALTDPAAKLLGEERLLHTIVESLENGAFGSKAPKFDPDAKEAICLNLFVREGRAVLGVDSAGRALHKRGWRLNGHPAVLKETLAASLLMLAGYYGDEILLDPMCGSGTLAIEAAYIALNKAPLIHRGKDDFALEHLAGFDRNLWRKVSDQLRSAKRNELKYPIYCSDIRKEYVELARASALKARVEKYIQFSVKPFQQWKAPAEKGLLVANLPYGERIGAGQIKKLYQEVGDAIHSNFKNWRLALLVPRRSPIHLFGIEFNQHYDLMNGALEVSLLLK